MIRCACGRPLHYSDPTIQRMVESLIEQNGPNVVISVGSRSWLVQRHYIALHGLRAMSTELGLRGNYEMKQDSL